MLYCEPQGLRLESLWRTQVCFSILFMCTNKFNLSALFLYSQLSDAVSVIGREDFPQKWTNLLPVGNDKEEILSIHSYSRLSHTAAAGLQVLHVYCEVTYSGTFSP